MVSGRRQSVSNAACIGALVLCVLVVGEASAYNFIPLQLNNSWTYSNGEEELTFTVIGEETIGDHKYYRLNDYFQVFDPYGEVTAAREVLLRYDSLTDALLVYDAGSEYVRYDYTRPPYWESGPIFGRTRQTGVTATVPAGQFSGCLNFAYVGTWCGPDAWWFGEYLAPGIGLVRYVVPGGEFCGGDQEGDVHTYELVSAAFYPPSKLIEYDLFIGQTDLDIVLDMWGRSGGEILDPRADLNDDGFVGQTDLDFVLDWWGSPIPRTIGAGGSSPIPEPATLALLGIGALLLVKRPRK